MRHPAFRAAAGEDPEKRKASRRAHAARKRAADPEKAREHTRRYTRQARGIEGATGERREGQCPLCPFVGPLVLDHDHASGRVRGWICNNCNRAIGWFKDDPTRMRKAADYVENRVPKA